MDEKKYEIRIYTTASKNEGKLSLFFTLEFVGFKDVFVLFIEIENPD